jgi:hypothetical protein
MCKDLDGDGQQDLIIQGYSQAVSETAPMAGRISLFFWPHRHRGVRGRTRSGDSG